MCAAVRRIHFLDTRTLQEFACRPEALQWGYRDLKAPGIITGVTVDLHADARAAPRVREYLARCTPSRIVHKLAQVHGPGHASRLVSVQNMQLVQAPLVPAAAQAVCGLHFQEPAGRAECGGAARDERAERPQDRWGERGTEACKLLPERGHGRHTNGLHGPDRPRTPAGVAGSRRQARPGDQDHTKPEL